jgi:hypothetical protein
MIITYSFNSEDIPLPKFDNNISPPYTGGFMTILFYLDLLHYSVYCILYYYIYTVEAIILTIIKRKKYVRIVACVFRRCVCQRRVMLVVVVAHHPPPTGLFTLLTPTNTRDLVEECICEEFA